MPTRVERNGPEVMRYIEKQVLLQMLDHLWREHLVVLDHLRQVIGWRGLAQRDPLNEYKSEAFELFNNGLRSRLRESTTAQLMRVEVAFEPPQPELPPMFASHLGPASPARTALAMEENESWNGGAGGAFAEAATGGATIMAALENGDATHIDPQDPATWGKISRNGALPLRLGQASTSTATACSPEKPAPAPGIGVGGAAPALSPGGRRRRGGGPRRS